MTIAAQQRSIARRYIESLTHLHNEHIKLEEAWAGGYKPECFGSGAALSYVLCAACPHNTECKDS